MKGILRGFLYFVLPLLTICFMQTGCGSDDEGGAEGITYEDIENAFKAIPFEAGTQDVSIAITESLNYNFRIIIPSHTEGERLPLMMALHFDAAGNTEVHKDTDCYIEPGLAELKTIIISPNGGETVWGTLENQDKLRILIDLSTRFWPVDTDRVGLIGYSSGGNGTWFFAETQPATFSAGIAIASGYNVFRPDMTVRMVPTPLYVIHGEDDDFFPIDTVQYWVDQTVSAGSSIEFIRAPNLGHYQPCDYVDYIKDGVVWLKDVWDL